MFEIGSVLEKPVPGTRKYLAFFSLSASTENSAQWLVPSMIYLSLGARADMQTLGPGGKLREQLMQSSGSPPPPLAAEEPRSLVRGSTEPQVQHNKLVVGSWLPPLDLFPESF